MQNYIRWESDTLITLLELPKPVYQRIIIVDNQTLQRRVTELSIKHYLKGLDIEIIQFGNAEEALLFLQRADTGYKRTALFLDLCMPVMSGWQFLDKFIHRKPEQIDIYILSSSPYPGDVVKALSNATVSGYIVKPMVSAVDTLFRATRLAVRNVPELPLSS